MDLREALELENTFSIEDIGDGTSIIHWVLGSYFRGWLINNSNLDMDFERNMFDTLEEYSDEQCDSPLYIAMRKSLRNSGLEAKSAKQKAANELYRATSDLARLSQKVLSEPGGVNLSEPGGLGKADLELNILKCGFAIQFYVEKVLKKRWPEGEVAFIELIKAGDYGAKKCIFDYINKFVKDEGNTWHEAEAIFAANGEWAWRYSYWGIKARFELGEPAMRTQPEYFSMYVREMKDIGIDIS